MLVLILKLIILTPYDAPKSLKISYLPQAFKMLYIMDVYENENMFVFYLTVK